MSENKIENTNPANGEKTFTQEDVNRIVGERLAKEKSKADAALAERESQLAKRELMMTAREKISKMGLPVELLDALEMSSAEALDKSLNIVKTVFDKAKIEVSTQTLKGFQPGAGDLPTKDYVGDLALRKAMKLPG